MATGNPGMSVAKGPTPDELPAMDENCVKVICLGDSAVGKSKLVERFLMDDYQPHQLSTYALTLFRHAHNVNGKKITVDFWDTAGQERFQSVHPSYYHEAHSCILVFDVTRKVTYKNLQTWFKELRQYRPKIPVIVVANKIDVDYSVTSKSFGFPKKNGLPFHFVSASDGTNVVKVRCWSPSEHDRVTQCLQVFNEAIANAVNYKDNADDFTDQVLDLLREGGFD
eukprot:TRINITY_DN10770_c0_g1_i1.p1 TRINITY_DN10770_c0_g1~~TRINITY_DN10770_c0_g1_i1.p1  ORF type:complete len:225 (+),score=23.77 TRINITY_DN10770_c0_g1_i1:589-1263(+)